MDGLLLLKRRRDGEQDARGVDRGTRRRLLTLHPSATDQPLQHYYASNVTPWRRTRSRSRTSTPSWGCWRCGTRRASASPQTR